MDFSWILLASWFLVGIDANKFNVTYTELQFCKEYDVKSGYKYSNFFRIDLLKPNRNAADKDGTIVNLRLFVLATKDAHILLSPTDQIKSSPIYEIVLGAGGNTFNEIRRQRQSQPLSTKRMNGFLSPTDVMPLTVRILKSGNISVAITGQPPFLTAFDPNVLDVKYISFSTWGTAEAKWFYDCESDSTGDKLSPINQNRTDDERLEMDLFTGMDPNIVPVNLDTVFLEFDLTNADFNSKKSFMTSHGRFRANWIDSKMVWDKREYGGKSRIHFTDKIGPTEVLWTPQIRLINGKDDHFGSLPLHYTVTVFSNGTVWAESTLTTFSTWCLNLERNWPYEAVSCRIQIQLDHFTSANLIPMNKTFFISPRSSTYDFDEGEWRVIETKTKSSLQSTPNGPSGILMDNELVSAISTLEMTVSLQRNSLFYNQLISVPLIASFSLVLLSFWVERFIRIMLNALSLFILIAMILILADHAPNHYTPTVVVYYTCSLYVVWASLLTFTVHCWFKQRKPNIELFTQIASFTWVQVAFGVSFDDTYEYKDFEDDATNDFSKIIDRFLFYIFLMIFFICTTIGY